MAPMGSGLYRAQADALVIEAQAKRRLADEYDAAQARGEVRKAGQNRTARTLAAQGVEACGAADIGFSRRAIKENNELRDAEVADPGIVRSTVDEAVANREEPTRVEVRHAACRAQRVHLAHAQEVVGPHDRVTQISKTLSGASMNVIDHDRMIAKLLALLADLGWQPAPGGDAIDQLARLELLLGDDAAFVAGREHPSTVARWAALAEAEGRPIGFKAGISAGSPWLYVAGRLLDHIERTSGLPARRVAETRHRKLIEMRARAQRSAPNARPRAASARETCENIGSTLALDPDQPMPEPRAVGME
jgi:hypothetical protein